MNRVNIPKYVSTPAHTRILSMSSMVRIWEDKHTDDRSAWLRKGQREGCIAVPAQNGDRAELCSEMEHRPGWAAAIGETPPKIGVRAGAGLKGSRLGES